MTTMFSNAGKNRVEFKNVSGIVRAKFFTSFNDGEQKQDQLLQMKDFSTYNRALSWAKKQLN